MLQHEAMVSFNEPCTEWDCGKACSEHAVLGPACTTCTTACTTVQQGRNLPYTCGWPKFYPQHSYGHLTARNQSNPSTTRYGPKSKDKKQNWEICRDQWTPNLNLLSRRFLEVLTVLLVGADNLQCSTKQIALYPLYSISQIYHAHILNNKTGW